MPPPDTGDADLVGAFVLGPPHGRRAVVRWGGQLRDYHELAEHVDPEREAYVSVFAFPPTEFCPYFVKAGGSPRGYTGPAACPLLVFDVDREGDLGAALADTRKLLTLLLDRYGGAIDSAVGVYFSGAKGFHVALGLPHAAVPSAGIPATCKRLALTLAGEAGVVIDPGVYDRQRLLRLPNSRHPATGLFKRFLGLDEVFALNIEQIMNLARHPAGYPVPTCDSRVPCLETDWRAAVTAAPSPRVAPSAATSYPAVPKFVRDFIGFGDVEDPGRAVTLFRCAAALAEAGTPEAVITGLLEEPALKGGLGEREVRRQIAAGIEHARRAGGGT